MCRSAWAGSAAAAWRRPPAEVAEELLLAPALLLASQCRMHRSHRCGMPGAPRWPPALLLPGQLCLLAIMAEADSPSSMPCTRASPNEPCQPADARAPGVSPETPTSRCRRRVGRPAGRGGVEAGGAAQQHCTLGNG